MQSAQVNQGGVSHARAPVHSLSADAHGNVVLWIREARRRPGPAAAARPEAIKAIPVRHWGRWISAAIVVYLLVALIVSFVKNPNVDWHDGLGVHVQAADAARARRSPSS